MCKKTFLNYGYHTRIGLKKVVYTISHKISKTATNDGPIELEKLSMSSTRRHIQIIDIMAEEGSKTYEYYVLEDSHNSLI
jgi:hypothetical protein